MVKKLLFIISVLGSWTSQAQDYVVTQRNDTLRGRISIATYDIYDRVEVKDVKKKTHLTAMQVKLIVIKNETYHTIRTDEKGYRILKLVSSGFVSEYLARSPGGTYDIEYLVKRDGSSMEVPNISFKKIMANFLSDCVTIKKKIESDELNRKKMDQILREYNLCIENQTQVSKETTTAISENDPLLAALTSLQGKLEADASLNSKKDVVDLLKDMSGKVRSSQPIPNYLTEGLKDFLKDVPAYQADLNSILTLLKDR